MKGIIKYSVLTEAFRHMKAISREGIICEIKSVHNKHLVNIDLGWSTLQTRPTSDMKIITIEFAIVDLDRGIGITPINIRKPVSEAQWEKIMELNLINTEVEFLDKADGTLTAILSGIEAKEFDFDYKVEILVYNNLNRQIGKKVRVDKSMIERLKNDHNISALDVALDKILDEVKSEIDGGK